MIFNYYNAGGGVTPSGTISITQNGITDVTNYASADVNVSGGGGGGDVDGDVIFIDYDGTKLHGYTKAQINAMTSDSDLPPNPRHDGLTAQGWNWTVVQLKAQLLAMPDAVPIYVGQMYATTSGATEIDIDLPDAWKSPYLRFCVKGTATVDWGDSSTSTVTGSNLTTKKNTRHDYATSGEYTIKITVPSGSEASLNLDTDFMLLNGQKGTNNQNYCYAHRIKAVRIGERMRLGDYAFSNCSKISYVTIPNTVTSVGTYLFNNCRQIHAVILPNLITAVSDRMCNGAYTLSKVSLPSGVTSIGQYAFVSDYAVTLAIPSGVTSIGNSAFASCYHNPTVVPTGLTTLASSAFSSNYELKSLTIPSGITSISSSTFADNISLKSVTIHDQVTSIGNSAFNECSLLTSITIPSSVTSIGTQVFNNCFSMKEYHFKRTTPPTLSNTNAFSNIQSDCVIYVPYSADHSVLNAYKTASNWATYASKMQEEPQS